ncbi:MAG: hypothetical protein JSW27_23115 [Phycisphaerales bacterium]|nr:MAG: hypothetical protein JSW27_23115 [Phycisphaerales bacterium]
MCRATLLLAMLAFCGAGSACRGSSEALPVAEATFERAFEHGCSLVVAHVLSVRSRARMYYYRVRVVRTIVAGDLQKEEAHRPLILFAGASYGQALKTGRHYAMFLARDCPHDFSWAFRDDVFEVDPADGEVIGRLTETAGRIYAQTSILQFRRTTVEYNVELPPLSEDLASLCEAFRRRPGRRQEIGKKIFESDLGSRIDASNPFSSIRRFLPPRISCSRAQMLSLVGYPTWKSGWTYSWCSDNFVHAREGGEQIGVLSVTFDKGERAVRVLYYAHERSKWIRPSRIADRLAEQEGDPVGVARRFQEALRDSDWDGAVSLCSQVVRDEARRHDSVEAFFRGTVPIKRVVKRAFNPHQSSSRDGKLMRMSDEVYLDVGDDVRPARWTWALVRTGPTWRVDFEPIPLERIIQKERVKREFQEGGAKTDKQTFERAIRYVLISIGDEFVLGQSMRFRLEMRNVGDVPIAFYRSEVMVNDPMVVTDPNGRTLPYADTDYQTDMGPDAILPGETIVLADAYDVTTQYRILRPGPYTFQFKLHNGRSNVCAVAVKPGPLPEMERIVGKLLPILPAGWLWHRSLRSPAGLEEEGPVKSLYISLSGKPGGKGNRYGMTLLVLIGGSPADADAWLKEWFDFWGFSPWGPVYARVNEVQLLWPDHKRAIVEALGIL